MSKKEVINYGGEFDGLGFSMAPGVKVGNTIYLSGAGPLGPDGKVPDNVKGDMAGQTRLTLEMLQGILKNAGSSLADGVMFTVFIADGRYFWDMNKVWGEFFEGATPTRTTVQAALMDPDMLIEINAIAVVDE